jgi:hypothetical protein
MMLTSMEVLADLLQTIRFTADCISLALGEEFFTTTRPSIVKT